ncbi:MAG: pyridoxamine 5'-phosphate oxidase family protein [Acidobacteriota bacterium]|nr:pyridoxamine 5'-phosphate oxidase family protein [Acidobacteriota bacterium]
MQPDPDFLIGSAEELANLYEPAIERSVRKQIARLDDYCRQFIAASPMMILGTRGDASPRGDVPGFVAVEDDCTLLIPDRRGNNRLDSLRNIVSDPRVGLLFLVPGVNETLRVNGEARISRDPQLAARFVIQGKAPRTVIVVEVKEVYIHCARALVRADLWNPDKFAPPGTVPSFGTVMAAHTKGFVDGPKLDEENKTRIPLTLY